MILKSKNGAEVYFLEPINLHHFLLTRCKSRNWCKKAPYTGCPGANLYTLNGWYDLDFNFLVNIVTFLGSWDADIFTRSTNFNFFDLRQPQQPQIKSVKIQSWFCSIFVKILIKFSFDSKTIWLKICWEWQLT